MKFNNFLNNVDNIAKSSLFVKIYWIPLSDKVYIVKYNKVSEETKISRFI